jgi:hypothetical protein
MNLCFGDKDNGHNPLTGENWQSLKKGENSENSERMKRAIEKGYEAATQE